MGRDLDDLCAAIKRRAAMKAERGGMSDEEWERFMRTLVEDVRVALLIMSVEELALRTGIAEEAVRGIAADATKDRHFK